MCKQRRVFWRRKKSLTHFLSFWSPTPVWNMCQKGNIYTVTASWYIIWWWGVSSKSTQMVKTSKMPSRKLMLSDLKVFNWLRPKQPAIVASNESTSLGINLKSHSIDTPWFWTRHLVYMAARKQTHAPQSFVPMPWVGISTQIHSCMLGGVPWSNHLPVIRNDWS